jgi:hypothetical protein
MKLELELNLEQRRLGRPVVMEQERTLGPSRLDDSSLTWVKVRIPVFPSVQQARYRQLFSLNPPNDWVVCSGSVI